MGHCAKVLRTSTAEHYVFRSCQPARLFKDRLIDSAMAEELPLARPQSPHVQPSDASSSAHAVSSPVPVPGSPSGCLSSLRLDGVYPVLARLLVVADGICRPVGSSASSLPGCWEDYASCSGHCHLSPSLSVSSMLWNQAPCSHLCSVSSMITAAALSMLPLLGSHPVAVRCS